MNRLVGSLFIVFVCVGALAATDAWLGGEDHPACEPAGELDDNCNGEIDEQLATSDLQPNVTLTVAGFGPMTFNSSTPLYTYSSGNGTPNPGSVTVTSSGGGFDTSVVAGEPVEPE